MCSEREWLQGQLGCIETGNDRLHRRRRASQTFRFVPVWEALRTSLGERAQGGPRPSDP